MDKKKVGEAFYAWVRDSVAQLETEFQVGRLLVYYTAWTIDQGRKPTKDERRKTKAVASRVM